MSQIWKGGVSRREFMASVAAFGAGAIVLNATDILAQSAPGGILRIAQPADPEPAAIFASATGNLTWRDQVFETLTSLDPHTGEPRKILATDWQAGEDGKSFVVQVRDDVTFHSGRPFTAEDVVFTLNQIKNPVNRSFAQSIVASFASIEATGPYEVTITSDTPFVTRIFDVFQMAAIVDHETFEGIADGRQLIGTGAFKWQDWAPGARLLLTRNENYWKPDRPLLDGVEIAIISDATALANTPRAGVHIAYGVSARDSIPYENDPNFVIATSESGPFFLFGMDTTQAPFDNKLVRQAIGYAIDRQRIADQVFSGYGTPSTLYWPRTEPGMTDELAGHYSYDPEKARQMLDEAGVTDLNIEVTVMAIPQVTAIFEIAQFDLREVGINVTATMLPPPEYNRRMAEANLGQAFMGIQGSQGYSGITIVDALPTLRPGNPSKFETERYNELKAATRAATTTEAYGESLSALLEYMLDEAFMHVLVRTESQNVVSASVKDYNSSSVNYLWLVDTSVED